MSQFLQGGAAPLARALVKKFSYLKSVVEPVEMCVKFQLSVSESSRDIKGIVLPAGSVRLQTRVWHI